MNNRSDLAGRSGASAARPVGLSPDLEAITRGLERSTARPGACSRSRPGSRPRRPEQQSLLSAMADVDVDTAMEGETLHDFPAHRTELQRPHRDQLTLIAAEIIKSATTSLPVRCVRLIGHASTWRGLPGAEYARRARARAKAAAEVLSRQLASAGLVTKILREVEDLGLDPEDPADLETCAAIAGIDVSLVVGDRADTQPLVPNLVTRSDRTARTNRALNRRVEIALVTELPTVAPKPMCNDRDIAKAILDMDLEAATKARKEARFRTRFHRKAVVCLARKLTSKLVDGDPIDDDFIARWKDLKSSTRPKPVWRNFTTELKKTCNRRGRITEDDFINLYNTMVVPIEGVLLPLTKALMDLTPNPFGGPSLKETKSKIPECRAVKPIYLRSAKRTSVYWCLRGWTRPALKACFT